MLPLHKILSALDINREYHLSRLILLIRAFSGKDCNSMIAGITKLAKLDFLLRYPVFLEKALLRRGVSSKRIHIDSNERNSVESKMVRYRFGPWDSRYRQFINELAGLGISRVILDGRTVNIGLTKLGAKLANDLLSDDNFTIVYKRASMLKTHLDLTATNISLFLYETFPELSNVSIGKEISNEHKI